MKNRFARTLISVILLLLLIITFALSIDKAEKNNRAFLVIFVILVICSALFTLYSRKYEEKEENNKDAEGIEQKNDAQKFSVNKFTQSRIIRIAIGWLLVFLIFFIPFVVKNGFPDLSQVQSGLYSIVPLIIGIFLLFEGSVYFGLFIMKIIWGWEYKYEGPTGRGDLRRLFGIVAFVILFYSGFYIYKLFS